MKTRCLRAAIAAVVLSATFTVVHAGPADCETAYAALAKSLQIPNRQFVEQTLAAEGGRLQKTETVSDGRKLYVKVKKEWRLSPLTIKGIVGETQQTRQSSKDEACSFLHDETLDGENVELYGTRATLIQGRSSSRFWISKASGLLVKSVTELDVGGKNGRTTRTVRYEYKDIEVPKTARKLHSTVGAQ